MAISDYTSLQEALPAWLDCGTADIAAVIADGISNAEKRIFREIRVPEMETALSLTISSGVATVPSDYVALRYAYVDMSPAGHIEMTSPAYIYQRYPTRAASGRPVVMARDGTNFIFGPFPDSAYTIKGAYFRRLDSVSTTQNAMITTYPDLYLYACLSEIEPLLGRDQRMALWETKYSIVKDQVSREAERSRYAGNLTIRPG